jgi:ABC-2 type transport system permease protein
MRDSFPVCLRTTFPVCIRTTFTVARRELGGYFATPVASVFIVIFLVLQGALTFNLGNFFGRGLADLNPFFTFIPWVFLLLVPAITMRLWAEERRLGTIELLLSLPITNAQAVVGKFLAAWAFCAIALALTFPFVITVNILGNPDNGVIAAGYVGALLIAGAFLSVGAALSATTKNQVIAFVLALAVCFLFAMASQPERSEPGGDRPPARGDRPVPGLHPRRGQRARPGVLRLVHRVLAVRQHGDRRAGEGGLERCSAVASPPSSASLPSPPS